MKRHLLIGAIAAAALVGVPAADAAIPATDVGGTSGNELGEVGAQAQGGIAGYTGDLGNFTGTGVSWGVMATAQPSETFGFEVGYLGSRIPLDDPRTDGGAVIQNGLEGLAKLYAPIAAVPVKPFVGAGVGLTYANPTDAAQAGDLYQTDWITEIPLAAGVEYRVGNLTAGARATYSPFYGESFAEPAAEGNPQGSRLEGRLVVGGQF